MDLHGSTICPNLNKIRSPHLFHHFDVRRVNWHSGSKAIIFQHKKCKMSLIIRQVIFESINVYCTKEVFTKISNLLDVHRNRILWNEIWVLKMFSDRLSYFDTFTLFPCFLFFSLSSSKYRKYEGIGYVKYYIPFLKSFFF